MIKLGIYVAFFFMLLRFYGLPIHIMRDLFMTSRDFIKRLNALLRYRRAIQEMNRYPDATLEELSQDNTCIICREEMRPWDPVNEPSSIDRVRPKKLPCGHVLHLGCLKSWLERQQVCPTCRRPVTMDRGRGGRNRVAGLQIRIGGAPQAAAGQGQVDVNNNELGGQPEPNRVQPPGGRDGGPRVFNLGPIRLGFGANGQQARELAQQFGIPQAQGNQGDNGPAPVNPSQNQQPLGDNMHQIGHLLNQTERIVQRELQNLQSAQQELQVAYLLMAELQRLRQRRQQQPQEQQSRGQPPIATMGNVPAAAATTQSQNTHAPASQAYYPQFTTGTSGPNMPARIGSPFMARHGAPMNGTAIPAGSPDLPEGVTLPPGWSLIPLQRLDGSQPSAHHSHAPSTVPNGEASPPNHSTGRVAVASSNTEPVGDETRSTEDASTTAPGNRTSGVAGRDCTNGSSQTARPTPVVAPSPVVPNWGGAGQLFNSRSRSDAVDNIVQPPSSSGDAERPNYDSRDEQLNQRDTVDSPSREFHSGGTVSHETESSDDSTGKGKSKAATVEEAGDDDED